MKRTKTSVFDAQAFLDSAGVARKVVEFQRKATIFAQGNSSKHVMYIQKGGVKLSVVNELGKEAIVPILGPGDFFGEGCLAGQSVRTGTATALVSTVVSVIQKNEMMRSIYSDPAFTERFMSYLLSRNLRTEEDLIDQLCNTSEKRLARTLLLLSGHGEKELPQKVLPNISQETLAEMVGTTRSRVNIFMNKFRKLGYIEYEGGLYEGGLHVNASLLNVVHHG